MDPELSQFLVKISEDLGDFSHVASQGREPAKGKRKGRWLREVLSLGHPNFVFKRCLIKHHPCHYMWGQCHLAMLWYATLAYASFSRLCEMQTIIFLNIGEVKGFFSFPLYLLIQ